MASKNGITSPPELPKLLSADDIAGLLGVTPDAIRWRRKHGLSLPVGHVVAGRWVYCRQDVEEWLHAQRQSGPG
jgi:hypothetical protein